MATEKGKMASKSQGPRRPPGRTIDSSKLDRIVAQARKQADERMRGYREQSLRLHPWICARCGREYTRANLHELTVHHKDHNHDNNPPDGSNWENLCLYCHDWEHQKYSHLVRGDGASFGVTAAATGPATHSPFAGLKDMLKKK
jgi:HNH endonuclease